MKRIGTVLLGLGAIAALVFAYSSGPLDDKCGAPPTFTNCTECHNSFPVNSGNGILLISLGGITTYVPGDSYAGGVTLADLGQSRWGCEFTVLNSANQQAGTIVIIDPIHTQLSDNPSPNPDYLKHTTAGTYAGLQGGAWVFQWVAPPSGTGRVTFWVAGNAANNNGGSSGDYIYTRSLVVDEASAAGPWQVSLPESYATLTNYPNPFNARTLLTFSLSRSEAVRLAVFDATGRTAAILMDAQLAPGTYTVPFDGSSLASGTYFARLMMSNGQRVGILNLVM